MSASLRDLLPLFRELGHLKRIHSADAPGSIAERLFRRGWAGLVADEPAEQVALRTVAAALAAARLGDLDRAKLLQLGLSSAEATRVLERSFAEVATLLDPALASGLRVALDGGAPAVGAVPAFVDTLVHQPRAGVTCPGRPRIVLQPAENHAEHCLIVAVYAVIAAPGERADATAVFVASMAHHLHNVGMPDAGFTGEVLLGDLLDDVITRARDAALAQLDAPLAGTIRTALAPIVGDATPEARAFHIGDVLDRVLEIEQHLSVRQVTMADVLDDYGLVHDGPVKPLHDRILADAGLA